MSFGIGATEGPPSAVIAHGDTAIAFVTMREMFPLTLCRGKLHQSRVGRFLHDDIIGREWGSVVREINGGPGNLRLLRPTVELWAAALKHRTQIVQPLDQALVVGHLYLKPGSVVVEAGTGSAALTHALARAVAPTGHVYTFEYNEERARAATAELAEHGLADFVTLEHRDVCARGFPEALAGRADAVFLDLPRPHEALASAKRCLSADGGRIANYSPCVEQVSAVVAGLKELGFDLLKTLEAREQQYDVKAVVLERPTFSWDVADSGLQPPDAPVAGLEDLGAPEREVRAFAGRKRRKVLQSGVAEARPMLVEPRVSFMRGHTAFLTFASLFSSGGGSSGLGGSAGSGGSAGAGEAEGAAGASSGAGEAEGAAGAEA